MKRRFMAACAALMLTPLLALPTLAVQEGPTVSAAAAILVDGDTGRVLYEKNSGERRLIASITKLMTALVAVESSDDLNEVVTVAREDTLTEGSSMYLKEGEELTLESLLYGLLLASGNDAALAVARHCAGDVETFVEWMNRRADSLGMGDSHFVNPNGLNDDDHYSTAADMAKLAIEVMKHEDLSTIVGTKSIALGERVLTNHNKLLWRYEGCGGMKTGYTERAGRTLVSCARREGQLLIAVTLNAPDDWQDHTALFNYGFETYPRQVLALKGKGFRQVPVDGSLSRFVTVETASDVFYPLRGEETPMAKLTLPSRVDAPVEEGKIAGSLSFYLEGDLIGETYLTYAYSVRDDRPKPVSILAKVRRFLLGGGPGQFLDAFYAEPIAA